MAAPVKKEQLTLGYSPYGGGGIYPFDQVFDEGQNIKENGLLGIDALVLWGGEDIHPSMYKEQPHPQNGAGALPSARDVFERKAVLHCIANKIPIIGVCRGAQLLCAMAGGKLVQHMHGHGMDHHVLTNTGKRVKVTSTHHQMMVPFAVPHEMIAWSDPPRSTRYEGAAGRDMSEMYSKAEAEIVYFPGIRALAIQGHPEYTYASSDFVNYCNELVVKYLLTEPS